MDSSAIYLNRATTPDANRGKSALWIPKTQSGVRVNHDSALMYSTVWACVRVISEAISQLPWRVLKRTNRGNEILPTHPADRLLYHSPNAEQTPAVWRELVMHDVLTWGNAYQEIEFDTGGRAVSLYRIHPSRVEPMRIENDSGETRLWYIIRNDKKDPVPLDPPPMGLGCPSG